MLVDKLYNPVAIVFLFHKISFSQARQGIEPETSRITCILMSSGAPTNYTTEIKLFQLFDKPHRPQNYHKRIQWVEIKLLQMQDTLELRRTPALYLRLCHWPKIRMLLYSLLTNSITLLLSFLYFAKFLSHLGIEPKTSCTTCTLMLSGTLTNYAIEMKLFELFDRPHRKQNYHLIRCSELTK